MITLSITCTDTDTFQRCKKGGLADQVAEDKEADVENIEGALEGHCVGE